jgi:inhibitor of cysteine peptidase
MEDGMHTTTWRLFLVTILAAAVLSMAACGRTQTNLTMADNGKSISLSSGDTFTVTLDSNPTTGYSWSVTDDAGGIVQQQGTSAYTAASKTPIAGGGGTETLTFKAVNSGAGTLTLGYARPWEKGVAPVKTFSVNVNVK